LQHQHFRSSEEYLQTDMAFALDMAFDMMQRERRMLWYYKCGMLQRQT
jgi:hypothetical protein